MGNWCFLPHVELRPPQKNGKTLLVRQGCTILCQVLTSLLDTEDLEGRWVSHGYLKNRFMQGSMGLE